LGGASSWRDSIRSCDKAKVATGAATVLAGDDANDEGTIAACSPISPSELATAQMAVPSEKAV
jgi:hypothetical protein